MGYWPPYVPMDVILPTKVSLNISVIYLYLHVHNNTYIVLVLNCNSFIKFLRANNSSQE